ncbi:reverse transcriptase domain-containing protein [Tanacetum coccineum]
MRGPGQMIHCSAQASVAHNFLRLKEGGIYSVTNFAVNPNKEEYRVIKDDSFMLEFDGSMTFKSVSVKADGFVRYSLNLVDFDAIEPADNKYLIDVAGYVSNVGRTNHLTYGSDVIRVVWGNLGEVLVEKKTKQVGALTGCPASSKPQDLQVRRFNLKNFNHTLLMKCATCKFNFAFSDKVYLSSTSSTMILDDAEIPAIKALKDANNGVELKNTYTPIDLTQPVKGTIEIILMWAQNRKNNSATFHCTVTIDGVRTKTRWNFPSCGSEGCRKGATRKKGYFFCESYNRRVDFPMLRYRLELDVYDVTAQTVVVLFDEPTTALVGCSAGSLMDKEDESVDVHVGLLLAISNLTGTTHVMEIKSQSYYEYGTFESFTCCQLNPEEVCGDSVGSSTLDALDGVQTHRLSRPVRAPTVATPTKPSEPKRTKSLVIEDSDVEASGDSSRYVGRNKTDPISDSNKRKRVVAEVSSEDVSGLHTRMHPRNSASYDGMQYYWAGHVDWLVNYLSEIEL